MSDEGKIKAAKDQALDQARAVLAEHFENVLVVATDDGCTSPHVSTYGTPTTLLGLIEVAKQVVLRNSKLREGA